MFIFTLKIPLGVILAIPPFNYPVNLVVSKIGPARITGNPIVLKPPTHVIFFAYNKFLWGKLIFHINNIYRNYKKRYLTCLSSYDLIADIDFLSSI